MNRLLFCTFFMLFYGITYAQDPVPYKNKKDLWGFKVGDKIVVECQYTRVGYFSEGLAAVEKTLKNRFGNKYTRCGYINATGEEVIPLQFKDVEDFHDGLAKVGLLETKGSEVATTAYIDNTGKVAFIDGGGIIVHKPFSNGYAPFWVREGKYGYLDKTGSIVLPAVLQKAEAFNNGVADIIDEKGVAGKIDTNFVNLVTHENMLPQQWVKDANGKFGLRVGKKVLIAPKYNKVLEMTDGYTGVMEGDKWGIVSPVGKVIIPVIYEGVDKMLGNYAPVKDKGKWGMADKSGKLVVPAKYDAFYLPSKEAKSYVADDCFMVGLNGKRSFMDLNGKQVGDWYYNIAPFKKGLAVVTLNEDGNWRYIDKQGKSIDDHAGTVVQTISTNIGKLEVYKPAVNTFEGLGIRQGTDVLLFPFYETITFNDGVISCSRGGYTRQINLEQFNKKNPVDIEINEKGDKSCGYCNGSGKSTTTTYQKGSVTKETREEVSRSAETRWNPDTNKYEYVRTKTTTPVTTTRQGRDVEVAVEGACGVCTGRGKVPGYGNKHIKWDQINYYYYLD
jgi:hypothetical protein